MRMMTFEEKLTLAEASMDAELRGDKSEASRILFMIPLSLGLAKCALTHYGDLNTAKKKGLNFSEVEEMYGEDWYEHA
jgi:hypothetical protein